jgi:hypothetical protein
VAKPRAIETTNHKTKDDVDNTCNFSSGHRW